jgi:hypothetical protein
MEVGDDVLVSEYRHYCQLLWSGQQIYEANQWLLHFSSQIHCCKYCLEIIHNPHAVYSLHEIFFAIKILHQYLQARWELLDRETYPLIKEVSASHRHSNLSHRFFSDASSNHKEKNCMQILSSKTSCVVCWLLIIVTPTI